MFLLLLASVALTLASQQLAFPGASGFGRFATGGRQGNNCVVSSLADTGSNTLRDCLKEPNRIVTFTTAGIIRIKDRLVIPKSTSILGQTAPAPGITIYGNGVSSSNADNSVVRYIRIRMGKNGSKGKDALGVASGHNMIFDHVSISWGRDETFSINAAKGGNITVQDCIVGQGLETHSAGGLMQTANNESGGISLYRNLWVDNKTRNPKIKGRNEFVNNVIYNWGGGGGYIAGGDSEGESDVVIKGNYFVAGPSTGSTKPFVRGNEKFRASVADNWFDGDKDGVLNGKEVGGNYGGLKVVAKEMGYPGPSKMLSAKEAMEHVLREAGASRFRDAVDERMVGEVRSWGKMGQLIHSEEDEPMKGLMEKSGGPGPKGRR